jgi:hypothetical protein
LPGKNDLPEKNASAEGVFTRSSLRNLYPLLTTDSEENVLMKFATPSSRSLLLAVMMTGTLSACGSVPSGDEFKRVADTPISERNSDINRTAQEAVNFFAEKPVTLLETAGSNVFHIKRDRGQSVPDVIIGEINAAPMEFGSLLNQIAEQAGMNWRITGADKDSLMTKEVYFVQRSDTTLEKVLDELSELTDAFYKVEGDRIIFMQDELFVVRVPRMSNSQEVLAGGLENVGATDIFADTLSGTMTFRASRATFDAARRFMKSLEEGRDMVVYDFWVIDRNITDNAGLGADVNFTASQGTVGLLGAGAIEALGGAHSGMISGNIGSVGVEATAQFLRALGETETVARPTISMLSGQESTFTSGQKSEYIREINTSTSDSGETSSGTDVQSLEVGVKIEVAGAHNAGVISTDFKIDISELISFEEFDTGDVTLRLPKTAQRVMEAHLEARPGDVMVLGGIIRDREQRNGKEIIGTGIPTSRARSAEKTETIILVRPRLVQIRPQRGAAGDAVMTVGPTAHEARDTNAVADVLKEEVKAKKLLGEMKK